MINITRESRRLIINNNNGAMFCYDKTLESGYYNIDYAALYNRTNVFSHVFNFDYAGIAFYNVI